MKLSARAWSRLHNDYKECRRFYSRLLLLGSTVAAAPPSMTMQQVLQGSIMIYMQHGSLSNF